MPLTDPVAGRQTGGPAPLTITDLQRHAGWSWEGGVDRCENAVLRQFLVREQCGACDGNGVTCNTGARSSVQFLRSGYRVVWVVHGRGAGLRTVVMVGIVGGERRSAPPLAIP